MEHTSRSHPPVQPLPLPENEQRRLDNLKQIIPAHWLEGGAHAESVKSSTPDFQVQPYRSTVTQQIDRLQLEDELEFIDESSGILTVGKLAWINPNTKNYLFTNRHGRLLAIRTRESLVEDMMACRISLPSATKPPEEHAGNPASNPFSLLLDRLLPSLSFSN